MSTQRIKGTNGVIIDSEAYLELPKGTGLPADMPLRPGMMRYNLDSDPNKDGIQILQRVSNGTNIDPAIVPEWGAVVTADPTTGKIDATRLPDSLTVNLDYQGSADGNAIPAVEAKGNYYIITTPGGIYQVGDWIVSDGTAWDRISIDAMVRINASTVDYDASGSRNKHGAADQDLQTQTQLIIENALDRNNGDSITGNINFTNNARLFLEEGSASLPSIAFDVDQNTGLYRSAENELSVSTGAAVRLQVGQSRIRSNLALHSIDGTAAAPGYAFNSDTNMGMYRSADNQIGFATSGVNRFVVDSNGLTLKTALKLDNGTAATPSLTFNSDTNTGLYWVSADKIGFSAGAAKRFEISTTNITSTLTYLAPNSGYSFSNSGGSGISHNGSNTLQIKEGGRPIFELNSAGSSYNLGDSEVKVNGRMYVTYNSAGVPGYAFQEDPDSGLYYTGGVGISVGGTARLLVDTDSINIREPLEFNTGNTYADPIIRNGASSQRMFFGGTGFAFSNSSGSATILETKNDEIVSTVPVRGSNGSATSPTFSFDSDQDTGMYLSSAGVLKFSTGGTSTMTLGQWITADSKGVRVTNGSASEPTLTFSNNADTGFYTDGTNLSVAVGGVEVAEFTSAGLVPNKAMTFIDGTAAAPSITFGSDTNTGMYRTGSDSIGFTTNGTVRAIVDNSGIFTNQYVKVNNTNGTLQIGAQNSTYTHFNASQKFYFNQAMEVAGNLGLHGKSTYFRHSDGKVVENGLVFEDKYMSHTAGSNTTNVDTLIKDPKYNGTYQRSNTGPVGYQYGTLVNLSSDSGRFQVYAPHYTDIRGSNTSAIYVRTGWNDDLKPWVRLLTDSDIISLAYNSEKLENYTYAQVIANARSGLLTTTGKAADSNLLDGRDGSDYMQAHNANGYEGLGVNGNTSNWIRTTTNGLLPFNSGGASALGTSSWPFNTIYGNTLYEGGTALSSKYLGKTAKATSATTADNSTKAYGWTNTQLRNWLQDGSTANNNQTMDQRYLGKTAKAADSDKLDGLNSSDFLRSTATATNSSKLGGYTYSQVVANARSGYATTSYVNDRVTIAGSYNRSASSRWFQAGSDSVGFLPFSSSTAGKSYLGTSSWYFLESWVRNYRGYSINVSNNITAYSDIRLKSDIKRIDSALDKIELLGGYTYNKGTCLDKEHESYEETRETGVIAQEVEAVLPEAVKEVEDNNGDTIKTVAYGNMVGLLIEGIKEEKAKREALEDEVAELKALVQQLLNK